MFQRSAVRIQSSANIYIEHLCTANCVEKMKIKKKEAVNGPFKKVLFGIRNDVDLPSTKYITEICYGSTVN